MNLLRQDVWRQLSGNVYYGVDRESKITPQCTTPIRRTSKEVGPQLVELSTEEKCRLVEDDPRFGMLSLFKYHLSRGRDDVLLMQNNMALCSHLFSRWCALPILILVVQWGMWLSLVIHYVRKQEGAFCPGTAEVENKIMFFAVAVLYFVKSFYAWDSLVQRSVAEKVAPSNSIVVLVDALFEYGFVLIVWATNLWIVYLETSITDLFLNSVGLEFVMMLDNEFLSNYLQLLPEAGADIYDNVFTNYHEQRTELLSSTNRCSRRSINCLYTFVQAMYLVFPVFCVVCAIVGTYCK